LSGALGNGKAGDISTRTNTAADYPGFAARLSTILDNAGWWRRKREGRHASRPIQLVPSQQRAALWQSVFARAS